MSPAARLFWYDLLSWGHVKKTTDHEIFSDKLEAWLKSSQPKTLAALTEVFKEKSLALIFLILMAIPALPIPTGGITHAFEIIVMGLAPFFMFGKNRVPHRWQDRDLPSVLRQKTLPFLLRRIRWIERYSRPRGNWFIENRLSSMVTGMVVFALTLTAFLAPPFSGLDTLPALGVVLISLAVILDDALLLLSGFIIGGLGIVVVIGLGKIIIDFIHQLI